MTTTARLYSETSGEPLSIEDHDFQTNDIRTLDTRLKATETQNQAVLDRLDDAELLLLIGL